MTRTRLLSAERPGLVFALVATAVSIAVSTGLARFASITVSPLVVALVLGAVLGSLRRTPAAAGPGLAWTMRHVLRAGIVLLGLQLALGDVAGLGWRGVTVILLTVVVTFFGTLAVGSALGVSPLTRLYVATGFSICGAAAIAAVQGTLQRSDDPDAAPTEEESDALGTSLALVTLYGSLAIVLLPWLTSLVGLDDDRAGLWIGASVQEVGQVVAAAGLVSVPALAAATVAKLARVVLLAPVTAGVALLGPGARPEPGADSAEDTGGAPAPRRRGAPVPMFVLGFLGAVLVRSTGLLPDAVLSVADTASTLLLTAAMLALGTTVDVRRLVRTGARPVALGAVSTAIAVGVSLVGVLAIA